MAEFKVKISADAKQAATELQQFAKGAEQNLAKLPTAAAKSTQAINGLNKAVANANPTLVNFSRVIQDAPFGIIGIANNIDPLISSFQSLRQQSGSTTTALKSLVAGLAGPAGIALAVSAATTALIAFGPQIADAINGVSKFEAALRTASEEGTKAFAEARNEFAGFATTLNNASASINQQNTALKGLNGLLSEYGLEIKTVSDFQRVGNQVGVIYAQIKQNEAKATALASAAATEYAENVKRLSGTAKTASAITTGGFFSTLFEFAKLGPGGLLALGGSLDKISASADLQSTLNKETEKFRLENDKLIKSLEDLDEVQVKTNETKKAAKAATDAITQSDKDQIATKRQLIGLATEQNRLTQLAIQADKVLAQQQRQSITQQQAAISAAGSGFGANATQGRGPASAALQAEAANNALLGQAGERLKALQSGADLLANTVAQNLAPAVVGLFEAFGKGGDVIENLGKAFGQLAKQIATAIVQAAIFAAIKTALSGGTTGFGAAFGSIFGLAKGGIVTGPTLSVLGEGGESEVVLPLSQLNNLIGGVALAAQSGGGGGATVIRGNDIFYANNGAAGSFARLFG